MVPFTKLDENVVIVLFIAAFLWFCFGAWSVNPPFVYVVAFINGYYSGAFDNCYS